MKKQGKNTEYNLVKDEIRKRSTFGEKKRLEKGYT